MKKLLLLITAMLPFNKLRIAFYRWLCGYSISWDSKIGPFNWIEAESCRLESACIGIGNFVQSRRFEMTTGSELRRFNKIRYLDEMLLGEGATIVASNTFAGTRGNWSPYKRDERIAIGKDSIITKGHYIDASGGVVIGRDVTLAGSGIQVWTHGFDLKHTMIIAAVTIGDAVYIGSRSLLLQGIRITSGVSVGAGTIVSRSIDEPGFYVSSQLIRKSAAADYSCHEDAVESHGARYVRK
jgi:bifunctional N-acetylglucosamine-1-phosphate-uridyltransferase/glucosamine-1-phosphate-acetyltransferase GlmU-like protein